MVDYDLNPDWSFLCHSLLMSAVNFSSLLILCLSDGFPFLEVRLIQLFTLLIIEKNFGREFCKPQ